MRMFESKVWKQLNRWQGLQFISTHSDILSLNWSSWLHTKTTSTEISLKFTTNGFEVWRVFMRTSVSVIACCIIKITRDLDFCALDQNKRCSRFWFLARKILRDFPLNHNKVLYSKPDSTKPRFQMNLNVFFLLRENISVVASRTETLQSRLEFKSFANGEK